MLRTTIIAILACGGFPLRAAPLPEMATVAWTTEVDGNGSVSVSASPATIRLASSDLSCDSRPCQTPLFTLFTIVYQGPSIDLSFSWQYETQDTMARYDPFGYFLDGKYIALTTSTPQTQAGHATVTLEAGSVLSFSIHTTDDFGGRAQAVITDGPSPVPEPGSSSLILAGIALLVRFSACWPLLGHLNRPTQRRVN